jgi:pSer/pThr/pTyr-binding forkhead associated (FHA) protein
MALPQAERKGVAKIDARLKILGGPSSGQLTPIFQGKLIIGREEDCHLRIQSEFLSRHHCVLLLDEYTLRIRDLGSKNGTFVNGRRIGSEELILCNGDTVSVGDLDFHVVIQQPAPGNSDVVAQGPRSALLGTGVFDGETVRADASRSTSETPSSMPADDSTPARPDDSPPSEGVSAPGQQPADSIESKPP